MYGLGMALGREKIVPGKNWGNKLYQVGEKIVPGKKWGNKLYGGVGESIVPRNKIYTSATWAKHTQVGHNCQLAVMIVMCKLYCAKGILTKKVPM